MKRVFSYTFIIVVQFILHAIDCNAQWSYTNGGYGGKVNCMTVSGNNLFAGTVSGGVFRSTNSGESWIWCGFANRNVLSLGSVGTTILLGINAGGAYRSTNYGQNWDSITSNLLTGRTITGFTTISNDIFCSSWNSSVFRSSNNGLTWAYCDYFNFERSIDAIASGDNNIFAGGWFIGVYRSTNMGNSWAAINSGVTNLNVIALAANGANVFAGTTSTGGNGCIFRSTNSGNSWSEVNNGLSNPYIKSIGVSGTNIFVGTDGGVYCSTNNGDNWIDFNQGFITLPQVTSLMIANNYIIAGTNNQSIWRRPLTEVGYNKISFSNTRVFVFPNPTTEIFNIFMEELIGGINICLFNEYGAVVYNKEFLNANNNHSIDISELPTGIYFLKLVSNNFNYVQRIIKQ